MMINWHILGIEPTTDEREIRRAYARELKQRRPDQDPQGFQELREAFDAAKRYASQPEYSPEPDTIVLEEYSPPVMQEQLVLVTESWSRETLWAKAQSLSTALISDELKGRGELHHYLDNEMTDAIEARQAFSLMLAEALSVQPGLTRSLLNEVSAAMNWQLESYNASPLPPTTLQAFEEQIENTERENYWHELARKYTGSRLKELQWRLLAEKGTPIPWWGKMVPSIFQEIIEIRKNYPSLQERLNPLLLREYYEPKNILSWGLVVTLFFWVYTTRTMGQPSLQTALQSGLILAIVASFWFYSERNPQFITRGIIDKCIHTFFWLVSVGLLVMAAYGFWQVIGILRDEHSRSQTLAAILTLLIIPVGVALWQNRREWRTLPIVIIITALKFPVEFVRKLPPVINILALVLLSLLCSLIIQMAFF